LGIARVFQTDRTLRTGAAPSGQTIGLRPAALD
jgi:hypothetical protein